MDFALGLMVGLVGGASLGYLIFSMFAVARRADRDDEEAAERFTRDRF